MPTEQDIFDTPYDCFWIGGILFEDSHFQVRRGKNRECRVYTKSIPGQAAIAVYPTLYEAMAYVKQQRQDM